MACGKGKTTPTKRLSSAGTGFFYTTRKNVVRTPEKIALVKYDPVVRRRVLFNEHKIKEEKETRHGMLSRKGGAERKRRRRSAITPVPYHLGDPVICPFPSGFTIELES
jgi:large subunit ribosomal protein L33